MKLTDQVKRAMMSEFSSRPEIPFEDLAKIAVAAVFDSCNITLTPLPDDGNSSSGAPKQELIH